MQTQATNKTKKQKKITTRQQPNHQILSSEETFKMCSKTPFDESSKTNPPRFWDALGPFPRSVWIHPHTPEDGLDRACGRVLKRSVLASKGVWPHLPENTHVFADEKCGIQSYTRGHDDIQRVRHQKLNKVMLMTQHNMTQTLLRGHMDATCLCFPDDRYSHGHEPDKTKEIINQEDADRRKNEKFPKQIHLPKQATTKYIPEIPSNKDFPPLASLRVDRPPEQAAVSKSGSYEATLLKGKPYIQLHCGKPQRAQKQNQKGHPRVKSYPSAKTTPKIETQTAQGFISQPGSLQKGSACREKVILEGQRCSVQPVFAQFQKAEEQIIPKDRTFKGGYVELGRSADGAHMAQTRAGSSTGSVKNAAGPLDNAKCHIYHKDATVTKTKTTGPGPDISVPANMDVIQTWNSSGRCPLQNTPFFTGTGHGPQSPWLLQANCFLWFSEMDPMYMVVNSQFPSNLLPPQGFDFNPFYIGNFSLWPYQHGNCAIFSPGNVNPSAAGRHRFTCPVNVPPGFTTTDVFTLF